MITAMNDSKNKRSLSLPAIGIMALTLALMSFSGQAPADLQSKGGSAWTGKLTLEFTRQFDCVYQSGGQVKDKEFREQKLELLVSAEKIEFQPGLLIAMIKNVKNSGTIDVQYHSSTEVTRPAYYSLRRDEAQSSNQLTGQGGLMTMTIQQMSPPEQDVKDGIDIRVLIGVTGPCPGTIIMEDVIHSEDEERNETSSRETDLAVPLQVILEGRMIAEPGGAGTIDVSFNGEESLPNGKPASCNCPPIREHIHCRLLLVRE